MLPAEVIEGCGMNTSGDRNQVWFSSNARSEVLLSGIIFGRYTKLNHRIYAYPEQLKWLWLVIFPDEH